MPSAGLNGYRLCPLFPPVLLSPSKTPLQRKPTTLSPIGQSRGENTITYASFLIENPVGKSRWLVPPPGYSDSPLGHTRPARICPSPSPRPLRQAKPHRPFGAGRYPTGNQKDGSRPGRGSCSHLTNDFPGSETLLFFFFWNLFLYPARVPKTQKRSP